MFERSIDRIYVLCYHQITEYMFAFLRLDDRIGDEVTMKSRLVGVSVFLFLLFTAPLNLSNAYLRCTDFDMITIQENDTLWSIAGHYTADEELAADLREAIIEVNGLESDGKLLVGQVIRVPILTEAEHNAVEDAAQRTGEGIASQNRR